MYIESEMIHAQRNGPMSDSVIRIFRTIYSIFSVFVASLKYITTLGNKH
jgi:hypothetical protein